jgi:diacylglycerol kinase family enzyme
MTYQAVQVAVVNTPVFGGAFNLRLPGVEPSDQLLDVIVIEALESQLLRETVEKLLAALGSLASGHLAPTTESDSLLVTEEAARFALPGVHRYQARSIRIETPSNVPMTLDGEISARTPVEVRLARRQLRVLVPARPPTSAQ